MWAEFNLRSVRCVLGDGGAWIAGMLEGAREEKLSFVGEAIFEEIKQASRRRHNWKRRGGLWQILYISDADCAISTLCVRLTNGR